MAGSAATHSSSTADACAIHAGERHLRSCSERLGLASSCLRMRAPSRLRKRPRDPRKRASNQARSRGLGAVADARGLGLALAVAVRPNAMLPVPLMAVLAVCAPVSRALPSSP
jgi:hypothetical protein